MTISIQSNMSQKKHVVNMFDMPPDSVGVIVKSPADDEVGRIVVRDEFYRIVCIYPVIVAYGEKLDEYSVELWNHADIDIQLS